MIRWLSYLCAIPFAAGIGSVFIKGSAISGPEAGMAAMVIIGTAALVYFRYLFLEWRIRTGRFGTWKSERLGLAEFALRRHTGA